VVLWEEEERGGEAAVWMRQRRSIVTRAEERKGRRVPHLETIRVPGVKF
jgi:hypothetical protein